ncbi:hypothetical protein [Telmatospirillum sp.]|uniref:hypothetical protein n=1 Tax=Telmatospirillum sp. TaxID=2079197 RepID=UPI0028457CB1|nr:hypothetical protein [Telmatospirillum sp.]MDR3435148.1 hypothetical protein [Telmatospirillum sp.]
MSVIRVGSVAATAFVLMAGLANTAFAENGRKDPPACGAITFRSLGAAPQEGTQNAGLYRSRFGKIVLRADVNGGQAKTYFLEVNGKQLDPLKGALPASLNECLNSKHVKMPAPAAGASCLGERFRVVLDNTGKQKYVMLFALKGDVWALCNASQM